MPCKLLAREKRLRAAFIQQTLECPSPSFAGFRSCRDEREGLSRGGLPSGDGIYRMN